MARQPRQFEVEGIYHILNRGYDKRKIFLKEGDYLRFIECLYYFNNSKNINIARCRGLTPAEVEPLIELLVFVLMPNHFHLIIREIREGGISLFMKKLGDGFTAYFNTIYNRTGLGGIFQSRYKSVPIKTDIQLETIFSYVHTNPIEIIEPEWKDFKVQDPKNALGWLKEYKWSSYKDYLGIEQFPEVTDRKFYQDYYVSRGGCEVAIEDWVRYKANIADLNLVGV